MPETKKKTEQTVKPEQTMKPEQTVKPEQKHSIDTLKTNCFNLFGVTTSTFIGATSSMKSESEYTIKEVATKIEQWLKKGVNK